MIRAVSCALLPSAPADAACRQALALGLDISGSVDAREYRLQLDGVVDALSRPSVRDALFRLPGATVDLAVYEWSEPGQVRLTQPFVALRAPVDVDTVAARLRAAVRPGFGPSTGLGAALAFGADLLAKRGHCWRRVLDISGDGRRNTGPRPPDVRARDVLDRVTVNALVIGVDNPKSGDARQSAIAELSSYFRAEVMRGPDAFIETALGFDDYADAMERKLIRELDAIVLGRAPVSRYSGSDRSSTVPHGAALR